MNINDMYLYSVLMFVGGIVSQIFTLAGVKLVSISVYWYQAVVAWLFFTSVSTAMVVLFFCSFVLFAWATFKLVKRIMT